MLTLAEQDAARKGCGDLLRGGGNILKEKGKEKYDNLKKQTKSGLNSTRENVKKVTTNAKNHDYKGSAKQAGRLVGNAPFPRIS